jgi:hypothetical protein
MRRPPTFSDECVRRALIDEIRGLLPGCGIATLANLATLARRETEPACRFRGALHHATYRGQPTRSRREAETENRGGRQAGREGQG